MRISIGTQFTIKVSIIENDLANILKRCMQTGCEKEFESEQKER